MDAEQFTGNVMHSAYRSKPEAIQINDGHCIGWPRIAHYNMRTGPVRTDFTYVWPSHINETVWFLGENENG